LRETEFEIQHIEDFQYEMRRDYQESLCSLGENLIGPTEWHGLKKHFAINHVISARQKLPFHGLISLTFVGHLIMTLPQFHLKQSLIGVLGIMTAALQKWLSQAKTTYCITFHVDLFRLLYNWLGWVLVQWFERFGPQIFRIFW